jgi:hypothetical protein
MRAANGIVAMLLATAIALPGAAGGADLSDLGEKIRRDVEDKLILAGIIDGRIRRGLEIAPVPLDLKGKSRAKVGIGSYIVNAQGACNDCHTNPPFAAGGDAFRGEPKMINQAGYLAGGTAFGPFIARNLTPDASGKPAGLSLQQFIETMRTGKDFKNAHPQISPLLQVMPWVVYGDMNTADLEAIYEYLRAIPPIAAQ